MFAQAMVERGVLESAALSIADLAGDVGAAVETRTVVIVVLLLGLGFLLIRRR